MFTFWTLPPSFSSGPSLPVPGLLVAWPASSFSFPFHFVKVTFGLVFGAGFHPLYP
jgi:hypothetical protein